MFTFEEQEWMRANENILANSDLDTIYKAARGENFSDNFPSNLIIRIAIQRNLKFNIFVYCSSISYTEVKLFIEDMGDPIITLSILKEINYDESKEELKNHLVNNFGFTQESVETLIYSKLTVYSNQLKPVTLPNTTIGPIQNSDLCTGPILRNSAIDRFSELETTIDQLTKKIGDLESYAHYLEDKLDSVLEH